MTTEILALADAPGNLADFRLLPGQAHDLRGVPDLFDGLAAEHLLADRAFDVDWLRDALTIPGSGPKPTILCVEDECLFRRDISEELVAAGYKEVVTEIRTIG